MNENEGCHYFYFQLQNKLIAWSMTSENTCSRLKVACCLQHGALPTFLGRCSDLATDQRLKLNTLKLTSTPCFITPTMERMLDKTHAIVSEMLPHMLANDDWPLISHWTSHRPMPAGGDWGHEDQNHTVWTGDQLGFLMATFGLGRRTRGLPVHLQRVPQRCRWKPRTIPWILNPVHSLWVDVPL